MDDARSISTADGAVRRMRAALKSLANRATCLIPGLPQLWRQGEWWGLALAGTFALSLNLALLSSFVWSELLSPVAVATCWVVAALLWVGGYWLSLKQGFWREAVNEPAEPDLFAEVQVEYLRGNWYQAEALCRTLLSRDDHDAEAHLVMSGVLRRTGRVREARRQLSLLATLETADRWRFEIASELRKLDDIDSTTTTATTANLTASETDDAGRQIRQAA